MSNSSTDHYIAHEPVLLQESVAQLVTDPDGIYVDVTLGGGGHSQAILKALSEDGRLFGIDQDDEALEASHERIGDDPRFQAIKGNFGYLATLLPPDLHGKITGILMDLGVSTHQISEAERGFSFQEEGPLDMRMGNLMGKSAYDVVNGTDYQELRDIIYQYGEEKMSRQIAREIIDRRPLSTTSDLAEAVRAVVKGQYQVKSIARVFQAIRIEVNEELAMLKEALEQSLEILETGGRIVAISYHSLEDRIVKRFFKAGNHSGTIEKDFYGNSLSPIEQINDDLIRPTSSEVERNPASRSAKMRVARKIEPEAA